MACVDAKPVTEFFNRVDGATVTAQLQGNDAERFLILSPNTAEDPKPESPAPDQAEAATPAQDAAVSALEGPYVLRLRLSHAGEIEEVSDAGTDEDDAKTDSLITQMHTVALTGLYFALTFAALVATFHSL